MCSHQPWYWHTTLPAQDHAPAHTSTFHYCPGASSHQSCCSNQHTWQHKTKKRGCFSLFVMFTHSPLYLSTTQKSLKQLIFKEPRKQLRHFAAKYFSQTRAQLFACLFPSVTTLEMYPVLRVTLTSDEFGEDTDLKKLQALAAGCESRRETCFLLCVCITEPNLSSNTR